MNKFSYECEVCGERGEIIMLMGNRRAWLCPAHSDEFDASTHYGEGRALLRIFILAQRLSATVEEIDTMLEARPLARAYAEAWLRSAKNEWNEREAQE